MSFIREIAVRAVLYTAFYATAAAAAIVLCTVF